MGKTESPDKAARTVLKKARYERGTQQAKVALTTVSKLSLEQVH